MHMNRKEIAYCASHGNFALKIFAHSWFRPVRAKCCGKQIHCGKTDWQRGNYHYHRIELNAPISCVYMQERFACECIFVYIFTRTSTTSSKYSFPLHFKFYDLFKSRNVTCVGRSELHRRHRRRNANILNMQMNRCEGEGNGKCLLCVLLF